MAPADTLGLTLSPAALGQNIEVLARCSTALPTQGVRSHRCSCGEFFSPNSSQGRG
jgi:hypothetical protein